MVIRQESADLVGHSARRTFRYLTVAIAALLLFFYLALNSLVADSPTIDEQNHIARGLAFLRTGDPRLSLEHPPLVNALSALPLMTMPELRLPTDHPSWERPEGWYEFADLFLWQYNEPYVERIVFLSRIPIVMLTILLALAGFGLARLMWGRLSALVALILFLYEPNLMAHGRYSTTDLGGVLFTFIVTVLLWRFWQTGVRWSWPNTLAIALAMGAAFGSKHSAIPFLGVWLLLAILPLYRASQPPIHAASWRVAQVAVSALLSLPVVWAIYGFEWGIYDVKPPLAFLSGVNGPAPTYVAGVGQIISLTGGAGRPSFMLGQFSDSGFVSYFPVAFAVKTPLILLVLIGLSTFLLLRQGTTRREALFLLAASLTFYALTMLSALNIGYRHVLPALPYLLVLVSGLAAEQLDWSLRAGKSPGRIPAGRWLAILGCIFLLATTLWIHPHYLSFFNQLAGGPQNGYKVLIDSNLDWGQDMIRLRRWMDDNEVAAVNLGWFGTAAPDHYGIEYTALPGLGREEFFLRWWDVPFDRSAPEPGVYAISASNLQEMPLRVEEKTVYAWFRNRQPDDRIGYSILIYDVR